MAGSAAPADIDRTLEWLIGQWTALAGWKRDWPGLDAVEREVFHLEWAGIAQPRFREVTALADEGRLSAEQCTKLGRLLKFERTYRSFIEAVFAEV
jgi:hypothetical protein